MAKLKIGTTYVDATTVVSTAATSATLTAPGSVSLAGFSTVTGSTGADSVKLLGSATTVFGVKGATVATFTFDTKNTSAATVDTITGSTTSEAIVLKNTTASASIGVNVKFIDGKVGTASTITVDDASTVNDTLTLGNSTTITFNGDGTQSGGIDTVNGSSGFDDVTLAGSTNWAYKSGSSTVDSLTGTGGADTITLTAASAIDYTTGGGADTIKGSTSADTIALQDGVAGVTIRGAGGADFITLPDTDAVAENIEFTSKGDSTATVTDQITGFEAGAGGDVLLFTKLQVGSFDYVGEDGAFTGLSDGANSEAKTTQDGTDTLVQVDVDGNTSVDMTILLVGVTAADIVAGNFTWTSAS